MSDILILAPHSIYLKCRSEPSKANPASYPVLTRVRTSKGRAKPGELGSRTPGNHHSHQLPPATTATTAWNLSIVSAAERTQGTVLHTTVQ